MEIVVNHLTRMQTGYICVAGLSTRTSKCIRPCLPNSRLTEAMWSRNGGIFDLGAVVELGSVRNESTAPETEDRIFREDNLNFVEEMDPSDFWDLMYEQAETSFESIFGTELRRVWRGYAINEGSGDSSLGCFIPEETPTLFVDRYGKVKLSVQNGDFQALMSVADRRLYDDARQSRALVVSRLASRIRRGEQTILSVGLARAYQVPNDDRRRHWMQVNNIHLEDEPLWTESTLRAR